jgi:chemotaxis response regulator CheB
MGSAAMQMKHRTAGIILTGNGRDGIKGLGQIIEAGGTAFIQDPRSCLFKETPMLAADAHSVENLISDKQMAGAIDAYLRTATG